MSHFEVGNIVETNDAYFERFGRRVFGKVINIHPKPPRGVTIILCQNQTGKAIPEYYDHAVIFNTSDLRLCKSQISSK
jgi:hypothetical protein